MDKDEISRLDYIEQNCKDCSCKMGCDLYYIMLHIDKSLTNIKMKGDPSGKCSFKNIKGVNRVR